MKKVSIIAAAVAGALLTGNALAEDKVTEGWTVNGYAHLLYNVGESLALKHTYAPRRDYHAAGPTFSGNPTQVEFTVSKGNNYENGAWSKYVVKTEYGNNEANDSDTNRGFYTSSSGDESHGKHGSLEVKEAYIELGDLSYFGEGVRLWAGQRFLNRQAGIITKEFWKQSSGMGAGIEKDQMGFAVMSADPGDSYTSKVGNLDANKDSTTVTSADFYYKGVEGLGGRFDFDLKIMKRKHVDENSTAENGVGVAVTYAGNYYGFDGWTTTAITYGKGVAANRGVNFGQWSGNWQKDDESIFFTSYGVANLSDNWQLGTELAYWHLYNDTTDQVWASKGGVDRMFFGMTPSYKVNENFRMEATFTYAIESIGADASDTSKVAWGRDKKDTTFYTATLAPVFTVNADYWGRPQIKPFVTYMKSSDKAVAWSSNGEKSETRVGVEAEIWF